MALLLLTPSIILPVIRWAPYCGPSSHDANAMLPPSHVLSLLISVLGAAEYKQ